MNHDYAKEKRNENTRLFFLTFLSMFVVGSKAKLEAIGSLLFRGSPQV